MGKNLSGIEITDHKLVESILPKELQQLLVDLHNEFEQTRQSLLEKRVQRQKQVDEGAVLTFPSETSKIREDPEWKVAKTPYDIEKRWVEITGPTERKMVINALNSGADVYMADFEDATSPTWNNILSGQQNLRDVVSRTIAYTSDEGKEYKLEGKTAVLFVRPRGWHLPELHVQIDGIPIAASFFDVAVYLYHNIQKLLEEGKRPYFYLPKLESYLEARLWNDVFIYLQKRFDVPIGTIRATVLIETLWAAFEMEEILYELREHSAGLNAGRWDYIFSIIKTYQKRDLIFPDREQITMTVPFMRAYTELLVHTCHKRGAHAIGGMAAFVPSKSNPKVAKEALEKVRKDKEREVKGGFDGTWVAHPALVPVAREVFEKHLNKTKHQKQYLLEENEVGISLLTSFVVDKGTITDEGVRRNANISLQYLAHWLLGKGAVNIFNLMEDAATAEIARAQLWQWRMQRVHTKEGSLVASDFLQAVFDEEMEKIRLSYGQQYHKETFSLARSIIEDIVLSDEFTPFLTLVAYQSLNAETL